MFLQAAAAALLVAGGPSLAQAAEQPAAVPAPSGAGAAKRPPAPSAIPNPTPDKPVVSPATAGGTAMRDAVPVPVEKGDLSPVMANDGSGLPYEFWRGLDAAAVEKLIAGLEIPPRSPALHNLWRRLVTSNVTPPSGQAADAKFSALRLETLYRSGLLKEAQAELAANPGTNDPVLSAMSARAALAAGDMAKACDLSQQAQSIKGEMPKALQGQLILTSGLCAASAKDAAGAGLAAELARDAGVGASPGMDALDSLSIGAPLKVSAPKQWTLLDYKLVQAAGSTPGDVLDKAEPALLVALANDSTANGDARLLAAEAAARLNALDPDALADIYRVAAPQEPADALLAGGTSKGPLRRAGLLKAAESEQTPMKKGRLVRAFIDDAKRVGLGFQALRMAAKAAGAIRPEPELVWFAETGAEVGLASGNLEVTRRWVELAGAAGGGINPLQHWLVLADVADAGLSSRGEYLSVLEGMATRGRFTPDALHRLATVLDALQYTIPIPLWEAASRTPQPNTGHLPATGVLTELLDASKKKEFGRTVLLAMNALGANGAEGAHMIALGDSIRALKRAGLETDARRLGLEALLGAWPRAQVN